MTDVQKKTGYGHDHSACEVRYKPGDGKWKSCAVSSRSIGLIVKGLKSKQVCQVQVRNWKKVGARIIRESGLTAGP